MKSSVNTVSKVQGPGATVDNHNAAEVISALLVSVVREKDMKRNLC